MSKKSLQAALQNGINSSFSQDTAGATKAIVNRSAETSSPPEAKEKVKENLYLNLNQAQGASIKQNEVRDTEYEPIEKKEVVKPVKFHDTHKTTTYLVRNDITQAIEKLCKKGGKGFKTKFVNAALRQHLASYGIEVPE